LTDTVDVNGVRAPTKLTASVRVALLRARASIAAVALVYVASVTVGVVMVQSGNAFALGHRDSLVSTAQTGPVLTQTSPLLRAAADFGGNTLAASVDTLLGSGVVLAVPTIVYRGWVGGIVSVDGNHDSRMSAPASAAYYVGTLLLQLLGYSLAAGAGLNLGLALWQKRREYAYRNRLGIPMEAVRDVLRIYILVIPILLIASLWEFLSPWS
jgi:hypothetical protein